jgi:hypothetical protein
MDAITERMRVLAKAVATWAVAAGLSTRRRAARFTAPRSRDT